MRFGEIDIPDKLLKAQEKNELLVFAGAGVSVQPPTNLPNFESLWKQTWETFALPGMGLASRQSGPLDLFALFGFLERGSGGNGKPVRDYVKNVFHKSNQSNEIHKSIVDLFRSDQELRLITTNYDTLLSQYAENSRSSALIEHLYPNLVIRSGTPLNGIAYLHGSCNADSKNLILTDRDVAKAYMGESPVARKFLELSLNTGYTVFIGYSLSDPILKLLLNALRNRERIFAFCRFTDCTKWLTAGVNVVTYPDADGAHVHKNLVDALLIWSSEIQKKGNERVASIRIHTNDPNVIVSDDSSDSESR